ncbi:MAG: hypothetical protein KatS3mg031_1372 [Chitinophagales bacterium]|nr:MAG: hypothetical protein KatS3mg031_1372 [Chitinophagales bacterium]
MSFFSKLLLNDAYGVRAATGIAYIRIVFGCWWLYEVTLGKFWKLGSLSSGPNPKWVGPRAGEEIINHIHKTIEGGIWWWYEWFLLHCVEPYAATWATIIIITQLMIGSAMILGLLTRIALTGAIVMLAAINMIGSVSTSPIMIGGHWFLLFIHSGLYFGLDAYLLNRFPSSQLLRQVINLGNPHFSYRMRAGIASLGALIALWLIMQVTRLPDNLIRYVSIDMAVWLSLIAVGFLRSLKTNFSLLETGAGLLRMYTGYKMLWFVITNPHKKDLATLPGCLPEDALALLFNKSAASHVHVMQPVIQVLFEPYAEFWSTMFGLLQVGAAVMLITGWQPRLALRIATVVLCMYVILGFTRYAPFLLGYCLGLLCIDAGHTMGISGLLSPAAHSGKRPTPATVSGSYILLFIAILMLIIACIAGVHPNGYDTHVGGTVSSALAILTGCLFLVSWLGQKAATVRIA